MLPCTVLRRWLLVSLLFVAWPSPASRADEQALPPGALSRLGSVGLRGYEFIYCVAVSPDGKLVAFGGAGGELYVVLTATGQRVRELPGHPHEASGVGFTPGGKTLMSSGQDGKVRTWDLAAGKQLREFSVAVGGFLRFALSPDGATVAIGEANGSLSVWDTATGEALWSTEAHKDGVICVAFSGDGQRLASGGSDNVARIWDSATGKELLTLVGHLDEVSCIRFHPDRKTLVSGDRGGTIRVWNGATGMELRSFGHHPGGVDDCILLPDGKTLLTTGEDRRLRFWDHATGQSLGALFHRRATVAAVFTPDGTTLASVGWDGLRLWDVATWKEFDNPPGHQSPLSAVAISPDGKTIATASEDNTVRLWEPRTGKEIRSLSVDAVTALAFSADGKSLTAASWDFQVHRWTLPAAKEVALAQPPADTAWPHVLSADGRLLAATVKNTQLCTLWIWNVDDGKQVAEFNGWEPYVFLPGGRHFAFQGQYNSLYVGDIGFAQKPASLPWTLPSAKGMAISPDGRTIAAATVRSERTQVWLWEVQTGQSRGQFDVEAPYQQLMLAFTHDGRYLVSGDAAGIVALWNPASGRKVWSQRGHRNEIGALAVSPDGAFFVSAGRDATALCWDAVQLRGKDAPPAVLTAARAAELWEALGDEDAVVAYRAVHELAASPTEATTLLKTRLQPVPVVEDEVLVRWVRELDDDDADVRTRATEHLAAVGPRAESVLRRAFRDTASAEVRLRAELLLKALDRKELTAGDLRLLRGIEVLEMMATAEALRWLQELSKGEPLARVTQEATAVVRRRERR